MPSPAGLLTIETADASHEFRLVPTLDPPSVRVPGGFTVTPVAREFVHAVVDGAGLTESEPTFIAERLVASAIDVTLVVVGLGTVLAGAVMLFTVVLTVVGVVAIAAGAALAYLGTRDLFGGLQAREWRRGD